MVADKWSQLKPQLSPEARAEAERLARRPITAERLAEIAARDAAAQAAPWNIYECRDCREIHLDGEACFGRTLGVAEESFVNHARADVPDLVAHVRRLEVALRGPSAATEVHAEEVKTRYQRAVAKLPRYLESLGAAPRVGFEARLSIPESSGVYLLSEKDVPMYVGQARKLRNRYDNHTAGATHNQASFAFQLAKESAREARVPVKFPRSVLQARSDFAPHFEGARRRIAAMHIQWICIEDAIERYLFEPYAALALGTEKYNSFETH